MDALHYWCNPNPAKIHIFQRLKEIRHVLFKRFDHGSRKKSKPLHARTACSKQYECISLCTITNRDGRTRELDSYIGNAFNEICVIAGKSSTNCVNWLIGTV